MIQHLIAHALLLLFIAIAFYFIGKSTGKIIGRREFMKVVTDSAEKDAIYLIKHKIEQRFNSDDTKKKLTKQEQKTKDEEIQKRLQKSYEINGRLELFQEIQEIL